MTPSTGCPLPTNHRQRLPMIPGLFLRKSLTWDRDQALDACDLCTRSPARAETGGDFSLALEMTGRGQVGEANIVLDCGPARADNLSLARGELCESSMKSSSDLHNSVV